jgi:hypothetical protein
MKKTIVISIICLFFTVPVTSNAGTMMLGAKSWYTWWDSAVSEFGARETNKVFEALLSDASEFIDIDIDSEIRFDQKDGDGILYGPMLSYQTDDGLWSFSLAFMVFGSFSQDTDVVATVEDYTFLLESDLDLDRKEIDFAVSRKIWEKFRVFLGFKYQEVEYVNEIDTEFGDFDLFEAEATILMPTAGIGYVHPLSDKMAIGLQGGLLLVTGKVGYGLFEDSIEGWEDLDTTVGFNGEFSLSYMINQNLLVQAGYRYQTMKLKADFGHVPIIDVGIELDDTDTVHGFTVSAVYAFDL